MKKTKKSQWFTRGQKPARHGVYEVFWAKTRQIDGMFAFYGDKGWGAGSSSIDDAFKMRERGTNPDFYNKIGSWRGLADNSEKVA